MKTVNFGEEQKPVINSQLVITPDGIKFKNCSYHQKRQINALFITDQAAMVQHYIRCILEGDSTLTNKHVNHNNFCNQEVK